MEQKLLYEVKLFHGTKVLGPPDRVFQNLPKLENYPAFHVLPFPAINFHGKIRQFWKKKIFQKNKKIFEKGVDKRKKV